jgi:hypothetical protein
MSEPDAVFADDAKDVEKMGEAEEFPYALADFEELQLTVRSFGRRVEANESTETHAVHPGDIRQVQHDAFVGLDHGADPGVEYVGQARDQLAVAMHDDDTVATLFNLKIEVPWSGLIRHQAFSFKTSWNGLEWVRESFSHDRGYEVLLCQKCHLCWGLRDLRFGEPLQ